MDGGSRSPEPSPIIEDRFLFWSLLLGIFVVGVSVGAILQWYSLRPAWPDAGGEVGCDVTEVHR